MKLSAPLASGETRNGAPPRKRIGVIGSLVWDEIHGRGARSVPVEEWGGITYALSALDAALPDDWEIVPIMMVGEDLATRAREFLGTLRRMSPDASLMAVPYPAQRVELRYHSEERRTERLTGGLGDFMVIDVGVRTGVEAGSKATSGSSSSVSASGSRR